MSFRKFRFFFYLLFFIPLFLGIERLCHYATEGFSVVRITHPLTQLPASSNNPKYISEILSQPFTYLASGAQSYVFVSQDGLYVIKFFKFHHLRIPEWIAALPLPPILNQYRAEKMSKKERILINTFQSYTIAKSLLEKETALLYLHLNQTTHLHQKIHLIDKIGIHYSLDADSLAFVIQKRGFSFCDTLLNDIAQGNMAHAKRGITDFLELHVQRCKKGVGDLDPDFRTNFGYIDGHIVELDIGRFYLEEQKKDPEIYKRELYRITRSLKTWLSQHSSLLSSYLDEEMARIQGESIF